MVAAAAGLGPSVKELRASFTAETRDMTWAEPTEHGLRAFYASITDIGSDLRITCARTLCEVAGSASSGGTQRRSDVLTRDLQGKAHDDAAVRLGLKRRAAAFGAPRGPAPRVAFLLYFTRETN